MNKYRAASHQIFHACKIELTLLKPLSELNALRQPPYDPQHWQGGFACAVPGIVKLRLHRERIGAGSLIFMM
jgi:hypothetical protein